METHYELETVLDTDKKVFPVVDINIEFSLDGVMNQYASLYADLVILRVPVGLVGHWHTFPSVWIHLSQSLTYNLDNSLSQDVWFLVQMMMVGIWVVESSSLHWDHTHYLLLWIEFSGAHNSH